MLGYVALVDNYPLTMKQELQVARGQIEREIRPSGERYYRLDVPHREYLMGKDAIFVGSLCSDDDILETLRVGTQLSMYFFPLHRGSV